MIKINKTDISLTRGDSAYISFSLTDINGDPIDVTTIDAVRCQVKNKPDGELLFDGDIIIDASDNSITWHIRPEDTSGAKVGTYKWDAQVEFPNGDIFTFIEVSKFIVLNEITQID